MRRVIAAACVAAPLLSFGLFQGFGVARALPSSHLAKAPALPLEFIQSESDRRPEGPAADDHGEWRDQNDLDRRQSRSDLRHLYRDDDGGRRMRREHDIHHDGQRRETRDWRDYDRRDRRSGRGDGFEDRRRVRRDDFEDRRWDHEAREIDRERRHYGGRDIDGPARGLGLPYWAPD